MDLELSDDQEELRDNVRQVLEGSCGPDVVRAVHEATGDADELWAQMCELYWPALGIDEAHGGLGLSFVEIGLLAEELGRANAPGPLLATVTQFVPAVREVGPDRAGSLLEQVAAGELTGALAWTEADRWDLGAVATTATPTGDGWMISGAKTSVLSGADVDAFAVVARAPGTAGADGVGLFVVPAAAAGIARRDTLDPTLPLADVSFVDVEVGADAAVAAPGDDEVAPGLERAFQEATVAMALGTVGASRRIFEVTLDYLKVREQYDRIIGSFQALKHRMADMYLAVERANAVAYYAALTIAEDDPRRGEAAHLAKSAAGDCQRLLAQDGLQLHGGIGYTWENDLHFSLKRAKAGELLCGSSAWHRARLAERLGLVGAVSPGEAA